MYINNSSNLADYDGLNAVWGFADGSTTESPAPETKSEVQPAAPVAPPAPAPAPSTPEPTKETSKFPIIGWVAVAGLVTWGYFTIKSYSKATKSR